MPLRSDSWKQNYVTRDMFTTYPLASIADIRGLSNCRHLAKLLKRSPIFSRKLDYNTTEITVRILRSQDLDPTPSTYARHDAPMTENKHKIPITYGRSAAGTRQSTRIRQVQDKVGKRKLTISKQSTVKDIKVQVSLPVNRLILCRA